MNDNKKDTAIFDIEIMKWNGNRYQIQKRKVSSKRDELVSNVLRGIYDSLGINDLANVELIDGKRIGIVSEKEMLTACGNKTIYDLQKDGRRKFIFRYANVSMGAKEFYSKQINLATDLDSLKARIEKKMSESIIPTCNFSRETKEIGNKDEHIAY